MTGDPDPRRDANEIDEALAEYLDALEAGTAPEPEAFCGKHPRIADELRPALLELAAAHRGLGELAASAPPKSNEHAPAPSLERLGDFQLVAEIGRGGMGVVYEAEQLSLKRRVAVKVLPHHISATAQSVERFQREATTAARLRHPNIVEIHCVGEEGGVHFFAMELVEATPLGVLLERLRAKPIRGITGQDFRDALSPAEAGEREGSGSRSFSWHRGHAALACDLAAQVADALAFAHANGVVHRDVKPSNILVRADGRALLTDFGLARDLALPSLTRTGEFAGTPNYSSPEQLRGGGAAIDARSDVYSLGVTLYELLTLRRPFEGESVHEVTAKVLLREPANPRRFNPNIPRDLATIVLKAIEKEPSRRYAGAAELSSDLRAFLEYRPIAARPPNVASRVARLARRNPAPAALAALALVGFVGFEAWQWTRPGYVSVTSSTPGSLVFIDGAPRGETPLESVALSPGIHRIRLEKGDELFTAEEEVLVERGRTRPIDRALASRNGVLVLQSDPPGARVVLRGPNGVRIEVPDPTPTQLDLRAGTWIVSFVLPGFESNRHKIEVSSGGVRSICRGSWRTGSLAVTSNRDGATLRVFRGNPAGEGEPLLTETLPLKAPLSLPVGNYSLRADLVNHVRAEREGVRVGPESGTSVHLTLVPWTRPLSIQLRGDVRALGAADVDGDGLPEIVAVTLAGDLAAIAWDGSTRLRVTEGDWVDSLSIASADALGRPTIFLGKHSGEVVAVDADGARRPLASLGGFGCRVAARDFVGDGSATVLVSVESEKGEALALDAMGQRRFEVRNPTFVRCFAFGDWDGDGREEAALAWWNGTLQVVDSGGRERWRAHESGRATCVALGSPRDGAPAPVFAGYDTKKVVGFDGRGAKLFELPTSDWPLEIAALDLDGDGRRDVVVGTSAGQILGVSETGSRIFDVPAGSTITGLTAADLDGDGRLEVVAATGGGRVVVLGPRGAPVSEVDARAPLRCVLAADLDGDGAPELVTGNAMGQVEVSTWDRWKRLDRPVGRAVERVEAFPTKAHPAVLASLRTGQLLEVAGDGGLGRTHEIGVRSGPFLRCVDLDGDGASEIATATSQGFLCVLRADGSEIWSARDVTEPSCLAVARDERGAVSEMWVATNRGRIHRLGPDGRSRGVFEAGGYVCALALRDAPAGERAAPGPTREAIAAVHERGLLALRADGSQHWIREIPTLQTAALASTRGGTVRAILGLSDGRFVEDSLGVSASERLVGTLRFVPSTADLVDLDGDGVPELIATSYGGDVGIFSLEGACLFRRSLGTVIYALQATAVDLDGDSVPEVVAATGELNQISVWRFPTNDPRVAAKRRFLAGLERAESGDEAGASADFDAARFRWLSLDDAGLDAARGRLERASGSASAQRMLRILDRVRPR